MCYLWLFSVVSSHLFILSLLSLVVQLLGCILQPLCNVLHPPHCHCPHYFHPSCLLFHLCHPSGYIISRKYCSSLFFCSFHSGYFSSESTLYIWSDYSLIRTFLSQILIFLLFCLSKIIIHIFEFHYSTYQVFFFNMWIVMIVMVVLWLFSVISIYLLLIHYLYMNLNV